jgi:peptidoglycan/xylan/chitin deacetylase (PgdA/CDA1 family)
MKYFVTSPWWFKMLWPSYVWDVETNTKSLYLTFDDGPHPEATPFVLDQLAKYNAKASFFCIGKNVTANQDLYQRIIAEGHAVGNHTNNHLNGWKTDTNIYLSDIDDARNSIDSKLFRPPYGRIKKSQAKKIQEHSSVIMWSVLSGDFDESIDGKKCLENVMRHAKSGSIIVFHDSEKAFPRLKYALPLLLKKFSEQGFVFNKIGDKKTVGG